MGNILNALGSFGSSFGPSIVNGISGFVQNERNISAMRDAQAEANAFALKQQERAHDLNSFSRQIQEMLAAGMNPNLMSGSDFVGSQPVQNQTIPNLSQPNPFNLPSDDLSAVEQKRSAASLLNEQSISEKALRAGNIRLQASLFNYQMSNVYLNDSQRLKISHEIFNIDEQIANLRKQRSLFDAQIEAQKWQNGFNSFWLPRQTFASINKIISDMSVNSAQRGYLSANAGYLSTLARGQSIENQFRHDTYQSRVDRFKFDTASSKFGMQNAKFGVSISRTNDNMLKFNFGLVKDYSDLQFKLGIANSAAEFMSRCIQLNPINRAMDEGRKNFSTLMPFKNFSSDSSPYYNSNSSFSY